MLEFWHMLFLTYVPVKLDRAQQTAAAMQYPSKTISTDLRDLVPNHDDSQKAREESIRGRGRTNRRGRRPTTYPCIKVSV